MYILLQNGQSVTSAIKVARNVFIVKVVLSLKTPVLSVLVKYKSSRYILTMLLISLLLISKQVLPCPPNQVEEMPRSHVTLITWAI